MPRILLSSRLLLAPVGAGGVFGVQREVFDGPGLFISVGTISCVSLQGWFATQAANTESNGTK
jgi:hypothetical protein